eukprot:753081_1
MVHRGALPAPRLSRQLCGLCLYGSGEFHEWFIGKLRTIGASVRDSPSEAIFLGKAIEVVFVVKIPSHAPYPMGQTFDKPDNPSGVEPFWKALDSSFVDVRRSEATLSSIHARMSHSTPS